MYLPIETNKEGDTMSKRQSVDLIASGYEMKEDQK